MRHRLQLTLLAVIIALLSACVVPEKFEAKLVVFKDGRYSFHYQGTLIYIQKRDRVREEELSEDDEEGREDITDELAQQPGFKAAEYLGRGRYKVSVEKHAKAGEVYHFVTKESKALAVLPQRDGSILISSTLFDAEFVELMAALGGKIDGTLRVSVESGVKVIQHNADQASLDTGSGSHYTWHLSSPGAAVSMRIVP